MSKTLTLILTCAALVAAVSSYARADDNSIAATPNAYQAFSSIYENKWLVRSVFTVSYPYSNDRPKIDVRTLSKAELEKFKDLRRAVELADFVIFKEKCNNPVLPEEDLDRVVAQFDQLEQSHLFPLVHEISAIEKRKDIRDEDGSVLSRGGYEGFCDQMRYALSKNLYDDILGRKY